MTTTRRPKTRRSKGALVEAKPGKGAHPRLSRDHQRRHRRTLRQAKIARRMPREEAQFREVDLRHAGEHESCTAHPSRRSCATDRASPQGTGNRQPLRRTTTSTTPGPGVDRRAVNDRPTIVGDEPRADPRNIYGVAKATHDRSQVGVGIGSVTPLLTVKTVTYCRTGDVPPRCRKILVSPSATGFTWQQHLRRADAHCAESTSI